MIDVQQCSECRQGKSGEAQEKPSGLLQEVMIPQEIENSAQCAI